MSGDLISNNSLPTVPKPKQFDWSDIEVFLAVAQFKSLSETARHLGVNHSTVGRRLRALEDALNEKLFERTRLGFLLTDAGHSLLAHAEGMEAHAHSIAADFSDATNAPGGIVRVATMEALGSLYLAPRFEALYRQSPSIRIELVTASHWINLSKREADILISFPKPQGRRISVTKIGEFALHFYATPSYLAAHGTPASLDELSKHDFIDYIDELVQISAVRWTSDVLRDPNAIFRSTSLVAQYHAALSGIGIAMLPTFLASRDTRLTRILGESVVVKRDFWLAVHEDLLHLARVRQAISFLSNLIESERDFLIGEAP